MEFVMEMLLDLILEGSLEIVDMDHKKVPRVLRILAAVVLLAFCVIGAGFCIALIAAGIDQGKSLLILFGAILLLFLAIAVIYNVRLIWRKRSRKL